MIPVSTIKVSAKDTDSSNHCKADSKENGQKDNKEKNEEKNKEDQKSKKQRTVFIAAGHQQRGISSTKALHRAHLEERQS